MKSKTQFMKWYYKFPEESRGYMIWKPYGKHPMSLPVIRIEVENNTELGKQILNDMGWKE